MKRHSILLGIVLLCGLPLPALASGTETVMSEAEQASITGDWEKATTLYRQAVAQNPDSSLALSRLAGSLLATQKYSESIPLFQQAISKDASNAGAFIGMGIAYLHTGRYGAAQASFAEAKKLQPTRKELDDVIAWVDKKLAEDNQPAPLPHSLPEQPAAPAATPQTVPAPQGEAKP